jgi:hypothetical protein
MSLNGEVASLQAWAAEAEAAAGIARALARTPFIPDGLKRYAPGHDPRGAEACNRGRCTHLDEDATTATVAAVLLAGQELGIGPMAALRSIDVINGTPALRALAARALLLQRGHEINVVESTATRCVIRARRAGGDVQEVRWDMDRAQRLNLTGKPNWRAQPQAMLVARATAEAARWVAADAMLGLPLIAEELADGDADAEPAAIEPPPEPAKPKRAARRRPAAAAALPTGPPAAGPATPPAGPARPVPPEPEPEPPPVTKAQLGRIHMLLRDCGLADKADALPVIIAWIHREIDSTKKLTGPEASTVIDSLEALKDAGGGEHEPADE